MRIYALSYPRNLKHVQRQNTPHLTGPFICLLHKYVRTLSRVSCRRRLLTRGIATFSEMEVFETEQKRSKG